MKESCTDSARFNCRLRPSFPFPIALSPLSTAHIKHYYCNLLVPTQSLYVYCTKNYKSQVWLVFFTAFSSRTTGLPRAGGQCPMGLAAVPWTASRCWTCSTITRPGSTPTAAPRRLCQASWVGSTSLLPRGRTRARLLLQLPLGFQACVCCCGAPRASEMLQICAHTHAKLRKKKKKAQRFEMVNSEENVLMYVCRNWNTEFKLMMLKVCSAIYLRGGWRCWVD